MSEQRNAHAGIMPVPGHASEVFVSVQGEGLFVGQTQVFVRTAGCAATCAWCDTVYSKVRTPRMLVRDEEVRVFDNPVDAGSVAREAIALAAPRNVGAASLTGGEPLEQLEFSSAIAAGLVRGGLTVHLETNGFHADAFLQIAAWVDVVAMDVKLPSAVGREYWDEHASFLDALAATGFARRQDARGGTGDSSPPSTDRRARLAFIKIVVDRSSTPAEIEKAAAVVAHCDPGIPVILQPESGQLFGTRSPAPGLLKRARQAPPHAQSLLEQIDRARVAASRHLEDVRVIPQFHKMIGVR